MASTTIENLKAAVEADQRLLTNALDSFFNLANSIGSPVRDDIHSFSACRFPDGKIIAFMP